MDIYTIIFLALAVFIFLRLRSVLGQRTGGERPPFDRTARNANMLVWHRQLQLIDHGAALYFHHTWTNYQARSRDPFVSGRIAAAPRPA